MKRKSKIKYPVCPVCGEEKHRTHMAEAVKDKEALDRKQFQNLHKEWGIDSFASFLDGDFEWACDECLKKGRAIKANPYAQETSSSEHLAYHDSPFVCERCGKDSIFSKDEKKFWYEGLKFGLYSSPNKCTECRKAVRQLKRENKTLSDLLRKDEKKLSKSDLEQIIEIYSDWGKEERAMYYKSLLRKG